MTSSTLLARLPRGATQARCRRPRPAVCSVVTNHVGPRSPSRARAMASALVEPVLVEGGETVARRCGLGTERESHPGNSDFAAVVATLTSGPG